MKEPYEIVDLETARLLGTAKAHERLQTDRERFLAQLLANLLFMPMGEFHRCAEVALGRGVFTHEFADPRSLLLELLGERKFEGPIKSLERLAPGKPIIVVQTDREDR